MRATRSVIATVTVAILLASHDTFAGEELALKTNADVQVTHYAELPPGGPFTGPSMFPSLTWSGSAYGIAFRHLGYRDQWIRLARLDETPAPLDSDVLVGGAESGGGNQAFPSLVWTGSEYAVAFSGGVDYVTVARTGAAGESLGVELVDADRSEDPVEHTQGVALSWNGAGFGAAWAYRIPPLREGRTVLDLRALDAAGRALSPRPPEVEIASSTCGMDGADRCVASAWNGEAYGVAWVAEGTAGSDIYFARVDGSGVRLGAVLPLSAPAGESRLPDLVWAGSEYAIAWADTRGGGVPQVYFTRVDAEGNPVGTPVRVTNDPLGASWPELVATGTDLALFWERNTPSGPQIAFGRLNPSGELEGSATQMTQAPGGARRPSAVWTGSRFAVAWERDAEIFFAQIGGSRIDVRPGNPRNVVNLRGAGRIPVAILGSPSLDVSIVDPSTLRFGPWSAKPERDLEDVLRDADGDGIADLVVHFRIPATGIRCGHTTATLTGTTRLGQDFAVQDAITTQGCR